jgi:hypothetical protein
LRSFLAKAREPPGKLGLLRGRQGNVRVLQAIPKLADERYALLRAKAGNFVSIEHLHGPNLPLSGSLDNFPRLALASARIARAAVEEIGRISTCGDRVVERGAISGTIS